MLKVGADHFFFPLLNKLESKTENVQPQVSINFLFSFQCSLSFEIELFIVQNMSLIVLNLRTHSMTYRTILDLILNYFSAWFGT